MADHHFSGGNQELPSETVARQRAEEGRGVEVFVPRQVIEAITRYGDARADAVSPTEPSEALGEVVRLIRALLDAPAAGTGQEPVEGDVLPPVGSDVLIHLASTDEWVPHKVTGYYAWGDLKGDASLQRVFVRVIDSDGTSNARMLRDVRRLDGAPFVMDKQAATGAQGLTDERVFEIAEQYGWTRKGDAGQWIVCHTNAAANLPALVRAALAASKEGA